MESSSLKPEISVAEIYKKYIMTEKNPSDKQKHMETFQNHNILKYTNKNIMTEVEPPFLSKNSSL